MAKLKLNVKLKDERGNDLGTKIQCLVIGTDNNFTKRQDGTPIIMEVEDKTIQRTLKDVISDSLLYENPQQPLSGEQKSERYKIWLLVNNAKESVELKAEETVIIKKCIGECQPIMIHGQCEALIEGTK
jgi:hypothetical protein